MTQEQKGKQEKPKVARKRGAKKEDGDNGAPKTPQADSSNVVPIRGGLPVEVLGADETYANAMHIKIMGLMRQYEETYFKLAEALYEVREKKLYRVLDEKYETFELYVEGLGVEYRKARYLIRMWWWYGIEQNKNPKLLEGAQEIGWTKAAELVEVIDGRNAKRWFRLAKEMNSKDLARAARIAKKAAEEKRKEQAKEVSKEREREAREGAGDTEPDEHPEGMKPLDPKPPGMAQPVTPEITPDAPAEGEEATDGIDPPENIEEEVEAKRKASEDWKRWSFDVHRDSWQSVKDAFRYAKELAESDHKGHIFSLICLHYVSFYDEQKSVVVGEWLAQLERLTGLSMVAIDQRTKEIVYGSDLIDELASIGGDEDAPEQGAGD